MAQVGTRLGGHAFNHSQSAQAEEEYDRLRNLARQEQGKAQSCFDRAHQAYSSGDGAEAHTLSAAGKQHQASATTYNKQASDFIFRENNAPGRVPPDTIDLHGQYVEEASDILELRIRTAKAQGQRHLHVIVGKGNHSPGHVQKIKPKVEQICREEGLAFSVEENSGRIFVDLTGAGGAGEVGMPSEAQWGEDYTGGGYGGGGYGYQQQPQQQQQAYQQQQQQPYQQQQYPGYPQQQGRPPQQQQFEQDQQQQQQQDPLTACLKSCCTVM